MKRCEIAPDVVDVCENGLDLNLLPTEGLTTDDGGPWLDLSLKNNQSATRNPDAVDRCIQQFLRDDRITKIGKSEVLTLNPITMVIKPDKERLCIDVSRRLNPRIKTEGFNMPDVRMRQKAFHEGLWMTKLDLKNGYLHLRVKEEFWGHLAMQWKDEFYAFKYMAFGISSAPQVFQRVMNACLEPLNKRGIQSTSYLDDVWIEGKSPRECRYNTREVTKHLEALGFTINYKKSEIKPSQTMDYLGLRFDGRDGTIRLTEEKRDKAIKLLKAVCKRSSQRDLQTLTGFLNFLTIVVKEGRAHMAGLYRNFAKKGADPDHLLADARKDIRWWLNVLINKDPFLPQRNKPVVVWTTDASGIGSGAYSSEGKMYRLDWDKEDVHSNIRELTTAVDVVRREAANHPNSHIHIRMDNTSSIATINKGGSSSVDLNRLRQDLWSIQNRHQVTLSASFIRGEDNQVADALSRRKRRAVDVIDSHSTTFNNDQVSPTDPVELIPKELLPYKAEEVANLARQGTPTIPGYYEGRTKISQSGKKARIDPGNNRAEILVNSGKEKLPGITGKANESQRDVGIKTELVDEINN